MRLIFEHERAAIFHGDSADLDLPENSIDAIVCDPPAGIGFMSNGWDLSRVNLPDPSFLNWFAGFVDGEGCFSVHTKTSTGYETYDCQFSLSLRRDDEPIIREIHRRLGIGTVALRDRSDEQRPNTNPQVRYCISAKADCLRLVEILRAAPLRAKKAQDFELWCDALDAWMHHRPNEWSDMRAARERLMSARRYTEYGKYAGPPDRRGFIGNLKLALRPAFRALKPGGHGLFWALPRTAHWTALALEDLGFEIRDSICHLFGTGFPKSLNVEGMGTALKPGGEVWWLARKPLDGTVAENIRKWGTGGLNIDGCRIGNDVRYNNPSGGSPDDGAIFGLGMRGKGEGTVAVGRWPANVVYTHDAGCIEVGIQEDTHVVGVGPKLGEASRTLKFGMGTRETTTKWACVEGCPVRQLDAHQGASRFYYCAKPSRAEKEAGLDHLPVRSGSEITGRAEGSAGIQNPRAGTGARGGARNYHPTVKSIALMRYLCRLVTPPGGTILDPFSGSGTTGIAALAEGFGFIGCELTNDYLPILVGRVRHALGLPAERPGGEPR